MIFPGIPSSLVGGVADYPGSVSAVSTAPTTTTPTPSMLAEINSSLGVASAYSAPHGANLIDKTVSLDIQAHGCFIEFINKVLVFTHLTES